MKTLDEVIMAMDHVEFCCTNCKLQFDCDEVECFLEDALHYLREFQGLSKMWNDKLDKEQENPPLTWDELRAMCGKPVWVEYSGYTPNWEIVENNGAVRGSAGDFTGRFVETNMSILRKEEQGNTWQAYRKERADGLSA